MSYVYFIQAVSGGPIKIGVADDPARRLMAIQPGNPERLRILGVIHDGGRDLERELHFQFRASRLYGEWFEPSAELLAYVAREAVAFEPTRERPTHRMERSALGIKVRHLQLRELRLRRGRSVSAVAADAGISVQYLSFIERGERNPLPPVFERICDVLGVEDRQELLASTP